MLEHPQAPSSPEAPPPPESIDPKVMQLYLAIKSGNDAEAERLIVEKVDFSVPSTEEFETVIMGRKIRCNQETALTLALKLGKKSLAHKMIDSCKEPEKLNAVNGSAETALIIAAKNGDTDTADRLLKNGANQATNRIGDTALTVAADNGHKDTVKLLLEKGADFGTNIYHKVKLSSAASRGHTDIVAMLLEAWAKPENFSQLINDTLLSIACREGLTDIVTLLLEKGADIEAINNVKDTALILAATYGHNDKVTLLLEKGANIKAINNVKETALIRAAAKGHTDTVALLLKAGANKDAIDIEGYTALTRAFLNKYTAVVDLLLKANDINSADKDGNTQLMLAARGNYSMPTSEFFIERWENLLKFFIEKKANLNLRNHKGDTAFSIAVKRNSFVAQKALYESGADIFIGGVEHEHQVNYIAKILKFHPLEKLAGLMCSKDNSETSIKLFLNYAAEHGRADLISKVINRYKVIPENIRNALKDKATIIQVITCITRDRVNIKQANLNIFNTIANINAGRPEEISDCINKSRADIEYQAVQASKVAKFFSDCYKKSGGCSFKLRGREISASKDGALLNKIRIVDFSKPEILTELLRSAVMSESGNEFFAQFINQGASPNIRTKDGQTLLDFVLVRIAFFHCKDNQTDSFKQEELKFKDVFRAFMLSRLTDINLGSLNGQTPLHTAVVNKQVKEIALLILRGADINAIDDKGKKPEFYIRQRKAGEEEPNPKESEIRELLGMAKEDILSDTTIMKGILCEYSVDEVCVILEASGMAAAGVTKHRGILTALKDEMDKAPVLVPVAKEGAGLDDDGDIEMSSAPAIGSGKDERPGSGMAAGVITQSPSSPSSTSSSTSLSSTSSDSSQAHVMQPEGGAPKRMKRGSDDMERSQGQVEGGRGKTRRTNERQSPTSPTR